MKSNGLIKVVLRLGISLLLMWWVYRKMPIASLAENLIHIQWSLLPWVYVLLFLNTALSAWKWQILLRSNDLSVSFPRLFGSYLIGTFFSIFLPSSIGGDAYRIYDIARATRQSATSFASVLADRLSGFLALSMVALTATVFIAQRLDRPQLMMVPLLGVTALFVVIGLLFSPDLLLRLTEKTPLARFPKVQTFFERLLAAFAQYRSRPIVLLRIMLISFVFHCSVALCVALMARTLYIRTDLIYFFGFVPVITLMEALPISIYGLGIRDFGYAYFFSMVGMGPLQTRTLAIFFVVVNLIYALSGGVLFAVTWIYNGYRSSSHSD